MDSAPATFSFRIPAGYRAPAASQIEPKAAAQPSGAEIVRGLHISPMTAPTRAANPLVAGVVPGKVRFDAVDTAASPGASLPFYRHPADKNAATTAINVGRSLDAQG